MRYVVIGAGAIGGTIGVLLHEAGRDVAVVARGRHLTAISEQGLRLSEPGRSRAVWLPAAGHVTDVDWRDGDVALLCTKTQDSVEILDAMRTVAPEVPVVCVQNGVANERFAAGRFAAVQGICVLVPAEHLEPGLVVAYSATTPGLLDVGAYPHGADGLTVRIAADLTAAGFSSRPDPAIMRWKYRKLLTNLGNAAEAACGPDDPGLTDLMAAARIEGERCLAAAGIACATVEEDRLRRAGQMSIAPVDGRARRGGSTWQSLARGAGTVEAEFLNGEIIALGRQHAVPTPVNGLLLATAVEMAQSQEPPGTRTAATLLAEAG